MPDIEKITSWNSRDIKTNKKTIGSYYFDGEYVIVSPNNQISDDDDKINAEDLRIRLMQVAQEKKLRKESQAVLDFLNARLG